MIGILSDTHDHIEHVEKAVKLFEKNNVDLVIHAGDVCSPFVWPFFRNLRVPIKCVLGNNVGDVVRQQANVRKFGMDVTFDPFFLSFEHADRKFAVYHGDPYGIVDALAKTGHYDVVVYGHNHVPKIHQEGKTLLVNPGSLVSTVISPLSVFSKESNPGPSVALYDPGNNAAELVFL